MVHPCSAGCQTRLSLLRGKDLKGRLPVISLIHSQLPPAPPPPFIKYAKDFV